MENNKYYTPTIEEFHVGFEFEKYDDRTATYKENNYIPTNWHKFKYDLQSIRLSQLGTHLYSKTIRVKYLDKEDIESLGWKHELRKGSKFEKVYHLGEDIYTIVQNGLHILVVKPLCNKITIKHPNFIRDGSGNFDGYITEVYEVEIKNKSELKRLMKQLGINENNNQ